jgi:hypothetical protein
MKLYQIIEWFKTNFMDIILSQRKTLGYLVYGLMNSQKVGVASIGRSMESTTTARHNIKRVARYLSNRVFSVRKTLTTYQKIILSGSTTVYLIMDWTLIKNKGYQTLSANIISDGRSIPLIFKTYKEGNIAYKQTLYEIEMLKEIRKMIGYEVKVYVCVDRGFGQKPEVLKSISDLGFFYIARCKETFFVEMKKYSGKIKDFLVNKDSIYDIEKVIWPKIGLSRQPEKSFRLKSRFIIFHKEGFKEKWVLCTNDLESDSYKIILIYTKRMNIEHTFKDKKNIIRGFCFEKMSLSSAERYDRMLLLICFAYLFFSLIGTIIEKFKLHKNIMANTVSYRSISLFQLGKYFYNKINLPTRQIMTALGDLLYEI